MTRLPLRVAAVASATSLVLAACGGSGTSGSSGSSGGTGLVTLAGVVATGDALGNAAVSVACVTGSGSATADATSGHYSATLSSGAVLPCVLTATSSDGATTLHSVVTTGTVANITPLTELLVAQVAGAAPSSLTAASVSAQFTTANVAAGQTAVLTLLKDAGIDTTNITDLLTGSLTIGSGGSSYDGVLDALYTALAGAGSTLASLTSTVVAQVTDSGSTSASTDSAGSMLAPELLLKARSSTCDALRSGDYWMAFSATSNGAYSALSVDAVAGTILVDGSTTVTLTANGTCRYTVSGGGDLVVAPSGVLVGRFSDGSGNLTLGVGVPKQTHTLADAAGAWDEISSDTDYDGNNAFLGWQFDYAQATISGTSSQITAGCVYPVGAQTPQCIPTGIAQPAATTLAIADNGYSIVSHGSTWTDKIFAYRAGNGEWLEISANISSSPTATAQDGTADGSIGFGTHARTLGLPTVGTTSANWDVYMDTATELSTLATDTTAITITAIDSTAGSFTRTAGQDSGPTHSETLFINNPYDGFDFRDLATGVAASDGSTVTVRKTIYLKTGVGVSVNLQPVTSASATSRLNIAVTMPAQ